MTTTTSSSGPRNHTRTTALTADPVTGLPGPEMMAEALPFDTIPAEVLRDHFTKWLLESLTHSALQAAAQAATAATADQPPLLEPDPEPRSDSPPPRPQYVRIGDRSVWLTKPMLRSRGWTEAAIRDFLPGPEALKPNPRFAVSGAPMPVWKPETVARAEADPEWRAWLERSLQRRQTTLEALADTDDPEFRTRLELADQAIRDRTAPPTRLDAFEPASPAPETSGPDRRRRELRRMNGHPASREEG
jgi:hypothetical protein